MSAGAMVAGGLAFTLPGLWMTEPDSGFPFFKFMVLAIGGALLGTIFTYLNKDRLLEQPFPIGTSSSQTLEVGIEHGKPALWLFATFAAAALFTVLRDALGLIPAVIVLFAGSAVLPAFTIWLSPMAMGIGAIIGPGLSLYWLGSSLAANFVLVPGLQWIGSIGQAGAVVIKENLGLGLMIGTGVGILIKLLIDLVKDRSSRAAYKLDRTRLILVACSLVIMALVVLFTDIGIVDGIITLVGIFIATNLSGVLTGQTGINPMEIFAMLVLLACGLAGRPTAIQSFSITAIVAVSCGLGGDILNDLKSGKLLGTDNRKQVIGEAIGGVAGAVTAVFALYILKKAFGGFGTEFFPAPQATAIKSMVEGLSSPLTFFVGMGLGVALYLLGLPAATIGLGAYLSINISSIVGIGSLMAMAFKALSKDKSSLSAKMNLVGSGFLGGEGAAGVIIALAMVARLS